MKYNIVINQRAFIGLDSNLDFNDAAIFDFIKDFAHSPGCVKMKTTSGEYFWISHKLIIENLPMLGISSNKGVMKRIDKLVECGLIEKCPDSQVLGRSYYRFGVNYDVVTFVPPQEQKFQDPVTKVPSPSNKSSNYNNNKEYNHKYNKGEKPVSGDLFKKELILPWSTDSFKDIWNVWKSYKEKEYRFKFKSLESEQAAINKLSRLANGNEETARNIILQSVENGWKGFFELKSNQKNQNNVGKGNNGFTEEQQNFLANLEGF